MSVRDGAVEHRFVGLLASGAYRQSVLSIPTVGDRARAVLGLVDAGAETHTGRSIRNTLETLPRDLVFELDADRLAHLVIDIVGLQERQLVRIFDVAEPVGAWSTVLVYLPRTRFTARLPELVAETVAAAYGSPYRDLESLVGASTLARITLSVRRPDGSPPDLDRLADVVDEADDRRGTIVSAACSPRSSVRQPVDRSTNGSACTRPPTSAPTCIRPGPSPTSNASIACSRPATA